MEQFEMNSKPAEGSILRGLVGALLGAIIGGLLWGLIGVLTQQVFMIAGVGLGLLVAYGYTLFKGRKGAPKIIIVALCVILAVVLGEGLYNVGMLEKEYRAMPQYAREYLAELGYNVDVMSEEKLQSFYDMLIPTRDEFYQECIQDEVWREDAVKNLGQAMLFAALGAVGVIIGLGKKEQPAVANTDTTAASVQSPAEFSRQDDDSSAS